MWYSLKVWRSEGLFHWTVDIYTDCSSSVLGLSLHRFSTIVHRLTFVPLAEFVFSLKSIEPRQILQSWYTNISQTVSRQLQLFLCLFFLTFITLCQSCQNIHLDTVCELNIQWKRQWAQIHSISLAATHPYDRCFPQGALFSRTNEPVQFYKGLWETWELS